MPLVSGRVVDSRGRGIAGARVFFSRGPSSYADVALVTGDDGEYVMAAPGEGEYEITTVADEHGSATATVDVKAEGIRGVELCVRRPISG
jgi:Carboxypeptidase regulatory-like domain